MARTPPSFSLGIEEEYLLVDRQSRDLVPDPPESMLEECHKRLEGRVSPEFLRCQIEVGTPVCRSAAEARRALEQGQDDRAALRWVVDHLLKETLEGCDPS